MGTGGPDSKRRKSVPEIRQAPIEEACLNHLKEKKMVSLDSTNILDNILLEMGKVYRTLSHFKEEGGKEMFLLKGMSNHFFYFYHMSPTSFHFSISNHAGKKVVWPSLK